MITKLRLVVVQSLLQVQGLPDVCRERCLNTVIFLPKPMAILAGELKMFALLDSYKRFGWALTPKYARNDVDVMEFTTGFGKCRQQSVEQFEVHQWDYQGLTDLEQVKDLFGKNTHPFVLQRESSRSPYQRY